MSQDPAGDTHTPVETDMYDLKLRKRAMAATINPLNWLHFTTDY